MKVNTCNECQLCLYHGFLMEISENFGGGWEMSSPTHDWIEGVWPLGKVNRLMFYTVKR